MIPGAAWLVGFVAPAGSPEDDPFSMFAGWEGDQLLWLALLVPVAVVVFFIGSRRFRSQLGSSALVPRGRDRFVGGGSHRRDAAWRATAERLEQRVPTPIAEAKNGPLRVEGTIVSASGNLGGQKGRECVWRNRAGAGPQTAIGAEMIFIADETGRCAVEELEGGRIIAPTDTAGTHYESTSLYVGDRIEVIATFERDVVGEHEDPSRLVYGTLGADGRLDVRLLDRPEPREDSEEDSEPEAPTPSSESESPAPSESEP